MTRFQNLLEPCELVNAGQRPITSPALRPLVGCHENHRDLGAVPFP
jgi:hypothetical protein